MKIKKIKIGPVDTIIFFGGGKLLIECARETINRRINTYIFAVKRHLKETINSENKRTFEDILKSEKITFFHVKDINKSSELKSVITEKTMGLGFGEVFTFTQKTIELFKSRLFDFMVINLPQYRGGAHFTWQILRNDKLGSWNIQVINEEMVPGRFDSGEILMDKKYELLKNTKYPSDYFNASYKHGFKIFIEFLDRVQKGYVFNLSELKEQLSSYFPRLYTPNHALIDWSWTANELERFICAFDNPYCGASTFLNEKRVFLKKCEVKSLEGQFHPFMAGLIYRISNKAVFIATRDQAIIVHNIVDDKGTDLIPFLITGQRLYTPQKLLEDAMKYDVDYDSEGLVTKSGEEKK